MTTLNHLPATASVDQVVDALRRDDYVIIDQLVSERLMDELEAELDPFIDASPVGSEDHFGKTTRRTGALVARSPLSHRLIRHPTILGAVGSFLDHASAFQLMLTQVISMYPGGEGTGAAPGRECLGLLSTGEGRCGRVDRREDGVAR